MGYTTKDIAIIFEPKRVSLSALPNFVQFKSKPGAKTYLEANLTINLPNFNRINPALIVNQTLLYPPDGNYAFHAYTGTTPFIEVLPQTDYVLKNLNANLGGGGFCFFYDAAQVMISYQDAADFADVGIRTPPGTKYLRLSVSGPNYDPTNSYSNFGLFLGTSAIFTAWDAAVNNTTIPIISVVRFTEPSGVVHEFHGTTLASGASGSTFFVSTDRASTAENLRQALLADKWINANFEVRIPSVWAGSAVTNGRVLNIKSKGAGDEFEVAITTPNDPAHKAYNLAWVQATTNNNDSISGEASTVEISLDVYTDAPIFLGVDDKPTTSALLGAFAVTLSKTYSGDTIWFDVNGPFAKSTGFNLPPDVPGWFDTGTIRVFRFVVRVAGIDNFTFYMSNALYVLRGYGVASDPVDLEDYVYIAEEIKLLTNKPRTIYVRGQREYLNFILNDAGHGIAGVPEFGVSILYRAYDTLGKFIGQTTSDPINKSALKMVNTCVLRIDDALDMFPAAGLIRVSLARGPGIISNDLEYTVRPSSLHTLRQFSFLNRLGGWDSFNFDAGITEDVKVTFDTFTKTVTPDHRKGDGIETVYAAQLDDVLTVTGAPVTDDVAEWLKELAASTVVLDSEGRYVIKSEFSTPISDSAKNMQVPTMKYRTSETYTNE